jgi:hypothetical protein
VLAHRLICLLSRGSWVRVPGGAPLSIYDWGFAIYDLPRVLNLEQLCELLEKNRAAASAHVKEFSIGGQHFAFNSQPAIMGVVNLSADA